MTQTTNTVLTSEQLAAKYTIPRLQAAQRWLQCVAILSEDVPRKHPSIVALQQAQDRAAEALAILQSRDE